MPRTKLAVNRRVSNLLSSKNPNKVKRGEKIYEKRVKKLGLGGEKLSDTASTPIVKPTRKVRRKRKKNAKEFGKALAETTVKGASKSLFSARPK
tara:strand:- start:1622 stop:1903 length:282 start_codon:yes stop_codon:yes gene_type:complete